MRSALPFALVVLSACRSGDDASLRIAAASDTARAFEALASAGHLDARWSFAASGVLAKQLAQGAPFDVFVSADPAFIDFAVKAGACDAASRRLWAYGRLALVGAAGVQLPTSLADVSAPRFAHIAIANPETAPYGRAALQALARLHLDEVARARLVPADSILHALQFVDTGNAELGFVARSLLPAERPMLLVDAALHEPLEMAAVVCAPPERRARAQAFVDTLVSEKAQALLADYGYEPPPGGPAK